MDSIVSFLDRLRGDGRLTVISGHYRWPGTPDRFAVNSATEMVSLLGQIESPQANGLIFLNDLGSLSRIDRDCSISPQPHQAEIQHRICHGIVRQYLPDIEAAAWQHTDDWRELAHTLADALQPASHAGRIPELHRLEDPAEYTDMSAWLVDVESLIYVCAKPLFRPVLLMHAVGKPLPAVCFERTITNAASRWLHKLAKRQDCAELRLTRQPDGLTTYSVPSAWGPVELRTERHNGHAITAHNKCPAILAQLFLKTLKSLRGTDSDSNSLVVLYFIPSFDRLSLRAGLTALTRLQPHLAEELGARSVHLAFTFFTDTTRRQVLCETFSWHAVGGTVHSTTITGLRTCGSTVPARGEVRSNKRPIYVDNNASTRVDPRVFDRMLPFLKDNFGNASGAYRLGWESELAIENARAQVARLIGADADEVFFTSGATEANNWVLNSMSTSVDEIVTSTIEHKSVTEPLGRIGELGVRVRKIGCSAEGRIRFDAEGVSFQPNSLVSLMAVNNEMHSITNLTSAGEIIDRAGALFHTDAAQALGFVPLDVKQMKIGMMSLSAHKVYGPKGVGGLFVDRRLHERLTPLLRGGGQERFMRSGTPPTALIAGFGEACAIVEKSLDEEAERLRSLCRCFLTAIDSRRVEYELVGPSSLDCRRPGALCLILPGLDTSQLSELMPEIAMGKGSACNNGTADSPILQAIGLARDSYRHILRLAFGRFNTLQDAEEVADRLADAHRDARPVRARASLVAAGAP